MKVKIDTKEKFHVISIQEPFLAANMTETMEDFFLPFLENSVRNLVVNLQDIQHIDNAAAESLVKVQQTFYENNSSFVICELTEEVEQYLDEIGLLELINYTPTESEGFDIVQMEEIERELLGDQ
ncbi:MAG: STAS domain-containing protein [Flavitalea sp.]